MSLPKGTQVVSHGGGPSSLWTDLSLTSGSLPLLVGEERQQPGSLLTTLHPSPHSSGLAWSHVCIREVATPRARLCWAELQMYVHKLSCSLPGVHASLYHNSWAEAEWHLRMRVFHPFQRRPQAEGKRSVTGLLWVYLTLLGQAQDESSRTWPQTVTQTSEGQFLSLIEYLKPTPFPICLQVALLSANQDWRINSHR